MWIISKRGFFARGVVVAGTLLAALMPPGAAAQGPTLALTDAYNTSGQELFRQLAATPGNIVVSTYSVGTAMAMALAGARGETAQEMTRVLKQSLPRNDIDAANSALLAVLNGYDKSTAPPNCPQGMQVVGAMCVGQPLAGGYCPGRAQRQGDRCVATPDYPASAKLSSANALMVTRSGAAIIGQEYAALLADNYEAGIFQNVGLDDVNAWVARKTQGKIERMLDQLDPGAAAVILNAVYFKAKWGDVFRKESTANEAFNLARAQRVSVPTMRKDDRYALVARQGYRALRLPYSVRSLGMVVVLPNEVDGLAQVSARLDGNEIGQMLSALRSSVLRQVDLALPRFKTAYKANLVKTFQQLRMNLPFDRMRADFSGMTGRADARLFIADIVHRAMIDVMEDGTEAAAATAVVMAPGAGRPQQPEPFHVDRPFLFYIVDDTSGAILFQGRIVDPR